MGFMTFPIICSPSAQSASVSYQYLPPASGETWKPFLTPPSPPGLFPNIHLLTEPCQSYPLPNPSKIPPHLFMPLTETMSSCLLLGLPPWKFSWQPLYSDFPRVVLFTDIKKKKKKKNFFLVWSFKLFSSLKILLWVSTKSHQQGLWGPTVQLVPNYLPLWLHCKWLSLSIHALPPSSFLQTLHTVHLTTPKLPLSSSPDPH